MVKKLAQENRIHTGTWNIGSLIRKLTEIVDTMIRKSINIICLQETKWTKWVGEISREISHTIYTIYKIWYTGKDKIRNWVG